AGEVAAARESVLNNKLLANPFRNRRREKPKRCLNCVGKGTLLQENLSTIQLRSDGVLRFFGQYEPTMMRVQPCCQAARYSIVVCLSFLFLFAQPHLAAQGPASDATDFQELSEKANRAR